MGKAFLLTGDSPACRAGDRPRFETAACNLRLLAREALFALCVVSGTGGCYASSEQLSSRVAPCLLAGGPGAGPGQLASDSKPDHAFVPRRAALSHARCGP